MENADDSPAFVLAVGAMVDQCYQCDLEHSLEAFRQFNFNYTESSQEKSASKQIANGPAGKTTLLDEALEDGDDETEGSEETEQDSLEGAEITVKVNAKSKLECPVSPLSGVKTVASNPTLDDDVFDARDEEALEGIDDDYMYAKTPRGFTPTLADVDYIYRVVLGFTSHFDPKVEASNTEADEDSVLTELLSIRSKEAQEDGDESTAKSQTSRAVYTSGNIKRILEEFRKEANKNEVKPIMEELPMEINKKAVKNPWARLSTAIAKMKKRNLLDDDAEVDNEPIQAASKAIATKKAARKLNTKPNQGVSNANAKKVVAPKPDVKPIQRASKVGTVKKEVTSKPEDTPIQRESKAVVAAKKDEGKPANQAGQGVIKAAATKKATACKPEDELIQGVVKAIADKKETEDKPEPSPVECREADDAASIDTKELNEFFDSEEQAPVRDEAPEEEGHEVVAPTTQDGTTKRRNPLARYIRRLRGKNSMQVVVQDLQQQSDISEQKTPLVSSHADEAESVQSQRVEEVPSAFGVERILDDLPKLTYTQDNDTADPAGVDETTEESDEEELEVPDRYTPRNAPPEPAKPIEQVQAVGPEEAVQSVEPIEPMEAVQLVEHPVEAEEPVPEDQEFFAATLDTVTASTVDEEDFAPKRKNAIVNYVKRLRGKDKHALKEVVEDFERNERKYLKKIAGKFKNFQFDSEQRLRKILAKLRKEQLKRLSIVIASYIEKQTAVPLYSPRHGVNTDWQAAPWNKPILALTAE